MDEFFLRAGRYRDLDGILDVERAAFPDSPYRRSDFVFLLTHARGGFQIANMNDLVVGYVIAMGKGGAGMIQSIAVSPESRRKGIGEALMNFAMTHLAKYERTYLLVDTNNTAAISLYRKFSFRETGKIIEGYYRNGDDAVEMMRT